MARLNRKVADSADRNSPDSLLNQIRQLERSVGQLRSDLVHERRKREQTENELSDLRSQYELISATQDKCKRRHLAAVQAGKKFRGSGTAVICWNDWHLEERIDSVTVNGCNQFDLSIAKARIDRLFTKQLELLEFARKLSTIREIVLWLGGDLINNQLHEESAERNFLLPTEAIELVQEHLATGIDTLLDHASASIRVVTSYGNHGRTTKKRRISTGYGHSWEWIAYRNLARAYRKDRRITWNVGLGYHNWETVQGYDVRFHHGDAIRFQGGVGGLLIPARKKVAQWNKQQRAHLDVLGHFHQHLPTADILVSGCLCGHNAYAIEIGAEYAPPSQAVVVIDRDYGQILQLQVFVEKPAERYR